MEFPLELLWLTPPATGLTLAVHVLIDARRTLAAVVADRMADPRVGYVARTGVRRERRRVVMQALLLTAMAIVVFARHRIDTDRRIQIRNAAMVCVSLIIARQSAADVKDRRYLSRSLRSEALGRISGPDIASHANSDETPPAGPSATTQKDADHE